MVGGLVALIATHNVLSPSPFAIVPQALAVALMLWARVTFGRRSFHLAANPTEGGLVTTGPYRFIRHPIYASVCLFTIASVAAHGGWTTLALGALVMAGALTRIFCEEKFLKMRYPEYSQYAAQTRRLVPFVF